MTMFWSVLTGYTLGSIPVGFFVAQAARGVDLRRSGSGNVGATNVYRTAGLALALAVMVADVAKGATSVWLAGPGTAAIAAGGAAVVGHIYPVWLGFRGGKGVATATGVFGVLSFWPTVVAAAAFLAVVARTKYVSLGSIVATVTLPVVQWLTPGSRSLDIGTTAVAALILFRHRGNVARLWARREPVLGA